MMEKQPSDEGPPSGPQTFGVSEQGTLRCAPPPTPTQAKPSDFKQAVVPLAAV